MYKKPVSGKRGNLSQYGLLDIPDLDNADEALELSDDDIDLEAELAAISGGSKPQRSRKPAPVPAADLDAMIAASLQDIPSDDEGSGDEDDSELLNELQGLGIDDESPPPRTMRPAPAPPSSNDSSTISLLQERISNYTIAEKNAKEKGETSRARRFGRGLKTLNDLLKQAKAGKPINDEDIPPAVSIGKPQEASDSEGPAPPPRTTSIPPNIPESPEAPAVPPRTMSIERPSPPEPKEPPPPFPGESPSGDPAREQGLQFILKRKEEFKSAALTCKHSGEKALALEYMKVLKQFDLVVEAYNSGQEMDLNELPTPQDIASAFKSQNVVQDQTQNSAGPEPEAAAEPASLVTASTVDEALKQRLSYFQEQESKAKEENNSSKARRMGRIVKQYKDALRLHAAGKPVPVDELPTPNGYAPIPTAGSRPQPSPAPSTPLPSPKPAAPPGGSASPAPSRAPVKPQLRHEKQAALLMHRQKQFKEAALKEKKNGNIDKAREYLRTAKGFDKLIEVALGGLVVDMDTVPLPPGTSVATKEVDSTFDIVSAEDCLPPGGQVEPDEADVLGRLAQLLAGQLRVASTHRDHCRALGNIADANRFDHLAQAVKQDLDIVKVAKRLNQEPPKFHYEKREFSIVQCNTDLPENVLELTIVRGIAYNVTNPSEVDTYVKFEYGYPPETPAMDRTSLVKDTSSPQYDAVFSLPVARSRACLRFIRRHAIKMEVYSRGGWFSRDSLLGTVTVKLAPLETQVTLHDSYPLMDGRKPAGGSLEVRVRVRSALGSPQVEHSVHRWIVLDN